MVEGKVEKTIIGGPKPIIEIKTDGRTVESTEMQPFILADGTREAVKDIAPGDELFAQDGYNIVEDVNETGRVETVYDLQVSGRNVYFANGFAVEGGF